MPDRRVNDETWPSTVVRHAVAVGAAVVVMLPCAAAAQQLPDSTLNAADTIRLETIVVTATRTPVQLRHAPGAVTVIDRATIERSGTRTVAEALRTVPGLGVAQSAGPGAQTSVFMRGGESDYVQVLVDGVKVNDAGGGFNWAHLGVEDVERIEVVRGPASVLYGSDAVSGVVQIFTRAGGAPRMSGSVTAAAGERVAAPDGTYHRTDADVSLTGMLPLSRGGGSALHYGVTAAHTRSNGLYAFNSDYDNTLLSGRLRFDDGRFDFSSTVRWSDNTYRYPTSGSGEVVDTNQVSVGDVLTAGLEAGWRPGDAVRIGVIAEFNRSDIRNDDPADYVSDDIAWNTAWQQRRSAGVQADVHLPLHALLHDALLTAGAERELQRERTAWQSVGEFGEFGESSDDERANTAAYAQLHARRGDVAVTVGGRVDDNEQFGTFRTGRAALSWSPVEQLRVHGAAGTAFKEPMFYEQFATGYVIGNPALKPERSRSAEVGVEWSGGTVQAGAVLFEQRFRNLIQYTSMPAPGMSNYQNIGAARARGLELSAGAVLGAVRTRAAWTVTRTRVLDAGFGEDATFQQDQRLLRRPDHVVAGSVEAPLSRAVRGMVEVRHASDRDDLDFATWPAERVRLDGYTTADAALTWSPAGSGAELTLRVRNLFDERYEEIHNFPATGRVFQIGLRAGVGL